MLDEIYYFLQTLLGCNVVVFNFQCLRSFTWIVVLIGQGSYLSSSPLVRASFTSIVILLTLLNREQSTVVSSIRIITLTLFLVEREFQNIVVVMPCSSVHLFLSVLKIVFSFIICYKY